MSVDKAIEGAASFAKTNGPWAMLSVCLVTATGFAAWTVLQTYSDTTQQHTDYLIDEIKTGQEDLKEIYTYTRDRMESVVDNNTDVIKDFKGSLDKNTDSLDKNTTVLSELEKAIRERTGLGTDE